MKTYRRTFLISILVFLVLLFTLTPVRAIPAEINLSFNPIDIPRGGVSTMTIRLFNPNPGFDLTGATFTNNFPANLFVSAPLTTSNTCGGTLTAVAGGTSVALAGGTIPRQVGATPGECVITVNVTSVVTGNIINSILAGALTTTQGETNSTDANATLTVNNTEAITLTKLINPNTFFSGNTSVLTFNITNNDSAVTLTNVTFTDDFPPELTIANPPNITPTAACGPGINITGTPGTSQLGITNASIAPGATCRVSVTVTQTAVGTFTNTIPERTLTTTQGVTNRSTFVNYSVQANNLNITKTFGAGTLNLGATTPLTIRLRNPNPSAPAPVISVQDNLPAGLVIANPSGATINCPTNPPTLNASPGGTQVLLTGGDIPPNNAVCDIVVNVTATRGGIFTNSIASSDVQAGNGFAWNGTASATVTFRGMSLTKTFTPTSINPGGTSTVRITFNNFSTSPVSGVTLTDAMPANVTIVSTSPPTNCGPGVITNTATSVTLSNATLPGSASPQCFIEVLVTSNTINTAGHLNDIPQNAAQIDIGGTLVPFPHATTNARLFVVPVGGGGADAPLGSKSFAPGTIAVGQPATLTIVIRAPGDTLQNVNFTDNLPAGLTITAITTLSNTGCGVTNAALRAASTLTQINLVNGTITGGGGTCTITATVTTTNPVVGAGVGTYTNQMGIGSVTAVAAGNPGTPLSNVDAFSANLNVNANVSGSKAFAPNSINANGVTAMTIQINAITGVTLTNVAFADTFAGGLRIANPTGLTVIGCGTPILNGGVVNPGDTFLNMTGGTVTSGTNCRVTVNVTSPDGNGLINNQILAGGVTASFPGGASGQNNTAIQATLNVSGLTVNKVFQPDTIGPGGRSTLVITIRNFTTQPLNNLTVTDNLPNAGARRLAVANPSLAQTTCGTGVVTAVPGSTTISLAGGQIAAQVNGVEGICTIVVDVVPQNHNGPYIDSFATNTINPNQVTGQTPGGQTVTNPAAANANLNFLPLALTGNKSFTPNLVTAGGSSVLAIQLQSPGGVAITGVSFTDNLPTGMIVFSPPNLTTSPQCGTSFTTTGIVPGSASFSFSNLNVPATGSCTISISVTSERSGNLTNTIPAGGITSTSGATNAQPFSASLTYTPGLGLLKVFDAATITAGGTSTVRIRISNTNPFAITNVTLTDTLPAGVTIAAPLTTNHNCGVGATVTATVGGNTITLNNGNLAANGQPNSTCEFSAVVTSIQPGTHINDIPPNSVSAQDNNGGPITNATGTQATLTVNAIYSLGNRVWDDTNGNGLIDGAEVGIGNVLVRLLDSTGTTQLATMLTDANGYYRFDNLQAGDYIVEVAASNFVGGPLQGQVSTLTTEANPNGNGDSNDNGIDSPTPATNGIRSGTVTLGPGAVEPQNEPDLGTGQGAPDPLSNLTVDFGFTPGYSLGNRVWMDVNNNGLLDGTEVGVGGVLVRLLDSTGTTQIATTTTDANGYYRFDNLPTGNYIVELAASNFSGAGPLAGLTSSTPTEANPNADTDNNDNGIDNPNPAANGIRSGIVNLGPGTNEPQNEPDLGTGQGAPDNRANLTVDFGVTPLYSLGNRVWSDVDNNGQINGAEVGIGGVLVRLLDATGTTQLATTTTDANGYYRFDNLVLGNYVVDVAASNFTGAGPLVGLNSSTPTEANPNADVDSNDNGIDNPAPATNGIRSGMVTLGPGNSEPQNEPDLGTGQGAPDNRANLTVDFGFSGATTYSLGNRVWIDTNANGLLDGAEIGVGNVLVRLMDSTGTTQITTMFTDANGYYRFDNLLAGDYVVDIAASNFTGAGPLVGFNSTTPTVANPNTDTDNDDNGVDNVNPGANGIRSGTVTLGPGTTEPQNEPDLGTGQGAPDNQSNLTVDFGFVPTTTYSLGNRVWADTNANGLLDGAEVGVANVAVRLLDSTGTTQIATTTTDANGYYRFDNLLPGDYIVEVTAANFTGAGPLVGLNSSTPTEATPNSDTDNNDNGIDNPTPAANGIRSGTVTLGPGTTEPTAEPDAGPAGGAPDNQSNLTVDFGFSAAATYSLGNRVWNDTDNNGLINGAEVGVGNVLVRLLDSTGTIQIATTTTDANGYYRFDNLLAGDYLVEVAASNFGPGAPLVGLASSTPTEANPNSDVDSNDNGIDSPSPVGTGIRSGTVTLGPGNTEPTTDTDLGPGGPGTAPDDRSNLSVDFGFTVLPTFSLGNRVWYDTNDSGTIDGVEVGVQNVTVRLFAAANPTLLLATTVTDANGYYLFDNLLPGDYIVEVAASNFTGAGTLVGYASSTPTEANPNTDVDSDDNGINNLSPASNGIRSGTVTLGPAATEPAGENDLGPQGSGSAPDDRSNLTVDFGFIQATTYSLGNRVWFDPNDNGLIDGGETGIGGVTVNLMDATGATVIATTTTDGNGYYRFDNLLAGDYVVDIPAANFAPGRALADRTTSTPTETDPNLDTDNNDNGLNIGDPINNGVRSGVVTLGPGTTEPTNEPDLGTGNGAADNQSNLTVDFGFIPRPAGAGAGAGGAAPNIGIADPAITKVGDPALARPGDTVTFTITVTNHGTAPATGVTVTDPVPGLFIVRSATASQGTFSINGQTVTFNIGTVNPGQTVTLRIITQVSPNARPPVDVENTAYLDYNEGTRRFASASIRYTHLASARIRITRGNLPNTGERSIASPATPALIGLLVVVLLAALMLLRRRFV